ncbi:hypothetical protein [Microbacterium sp. ZXX196]|uniref:hypothetical protein n=1 Tax=Microbacterium sp. ZXX196 TaxID=2609291 RepID=UPI0012B9DA80|nr:hypothetical protein [Microbacterium sp. ZXX196]MTE23550.1 hypothetical protein [Microbacterium sp. ZXX196]
MSDAQGSRNDHDGDPIEDQSASTEPAENAPAETPAADEVTTAEPATADPGAEETTAEPEPTTGQTRADLAAQRRAETAEPAAETPEEEPDYEALAAELDRLEAETAAAAPVAPSRPEPEPETRRVDEAGESPAAQSPWFEPAETRTFRTDDPAEEPASVAPSEPTHAAPAPIFVQAPEAPRKRGNRGASGLIGLVAALAFAVLFAAATFGWQAVMSVANGEGIPDPVDFVTLDLLAPTFWVTVIAFWLAFWLLGAIVNRARWWSWVIFGLLVAVLTYVGFLAGVFVDAPFWAITAREGVDLLVANVLHPVALLALILAREVTIWFGAWVSKRGGKIAELNREEREEYDRLIADGPQARS